MIAERLRTLVLARVQLAKSPPSMDAIAESLARFAPPELDVYQWRNKLDRAAGELIWQGTITNDHRVVDTTALATQIGAYRAKTWAQLADKIIPALALGVAADDAKTHARLAGRDGWAAAIAGRVLGVWTDGPPPAIGPVCDAYAWRELGIAGKPKRCPPEVRAVFVQRYLRGPAAAPERQIRIVATTAIGARRPELRAIVDALVVRWLAGATLGASSFEHDVLRAAGADTVARFGDRKAFISSVLAELRRDPRWSPLSTDEMTTRLVAAHRAGRLVLARADLVAAMDPELVAASEIVADGASFHFVVREVA